MKMWKFGVVEESGPYRVTYNLFDLVQHQELTKVVLLCCNLTYPPWRKKAEQAFVLTTIPIYLSKKELDLKKELTNDAFYFKKKVEKKKMKKYKF